MSTPLAAYYRPAATSAAERTHREHVEAPRNEDALWGVGVRKLLADDEVAPVAQARDRTIQGMHLCMAMRSHSSRPVPKGD